MKRIFVLAMVLVAGSVLARSFDTGYEPDGLDELTKQKGIFKTTLINPEADFSHYTKVYQRKVILVVRNPSSKSAEQSTGSLLGGRGRDSVMPEFEEVVEFKQIFSDALAAELDGKTDLEMVHNAGPNTLVIRPVVTDVVITSSSKNKNEDGRELPELSYGTVVFDLIDGETGLIQGRLGERRKCKPPKGSEPTTGAWPNLAYWAQCAAADLVAELERMETANAG